MRSINSNQKTKFTIIGGVGFLIMGILLITMPQFITAQANIRPTITVPLDMGIVNMQTEVNKMVEGENKYSIETKIAALSYEATHRAIYARSMPNNRPTVFRTVTPIVLPESQRTMGIIDSIPNPLPGLVYFIENAWQGKINDQYVLVYAGYYLKNPSQGFLIIMTDNPVWYKVIDTPNKLGPVKISDFVGNQLVLETKNKDNIFFNVPGLAFISSLGQSVPLISPFPPSRITVPTINSKLSTPTIPAYP